jgi:RNA polymerase sigma-70 factor, ECF subfamily
LLSWLARQDLVGGGHIWVVLSPEARFDALYNAHYRAIYRYVFRRLAPRSDDVRDTVAEVFAIAWRRLEDAPEGDEELLWLYGVAYRCVLRARRADWRRVRLLARLTEQARTRPQSAGPGSPEDEVRDAIERLPANDREVLRLVMWDGLSHREAAGVLGCSTNAVAQRLHSARERLRVALADPAPGSSEITTTG